MSDQLDVLKLVAARLDGGGVTYMVTGSIASGFYGQPRMTRDIDIVAVLYPPHAQRLADLLQDDFIWDAEGIESAIRARTMFSVVHRETLNKVDVIVHTDTEFEAEKLARRRRVDVDGQAIWIISPEDLVLSKLAWAKVNESELQLRDVRSIITLQTGLDWAYIERWARRLTVSDLLKRVRP